MANAARDIGRFGIGGGRRRADVDRRGLVVDRGAGAGDGATDNGAGSQSADDTGGDSAAYTIRLRWRRQRRGQGSGRGERNEGIFHGCPLGPTFFGADHPPKVVTRSLRADESWTAPADEIAVAIAERSARPVATRASSRVRRTVALVNDIARGRPVRRVSTRAVRDRAADDGAADHAGCNTGTDRAAIAAGVGSRWSAQGADRQSGGSRKREDCRLHRVFPPESGRQRRP